MLRYTVVFLVLVALVSGGTVPTKLKKQRPDGRIIGGTKATIEDNPWQVSLEAFGLHNCGGSIISADTILTAAHCIDGAISVFYEVVSGTADLLQNGTHSTIKQTIVHEGYDGLGHDAALVILNEPLTFGDTIQAVPLTDEDPVAGDTVKVTGWGVLSESDFFTPNDLYGVEVTIVDRSECAADYADVEGATVDDTMVCAGVPEGGKDACSGDSGGPLTKDGVLVGIVSWGVGCAEVGYPGVYTSVASVRQWIKDNSGILVKIFTSLIYQLITHLNDNCLHYKYHSSAHPTDSKMLRYSIVFVFVVTLVSGGVVPPKLRRQRPHGRIVGGNTETIEDNPWQVSLQVFGLHNCGGSIISEDTILTAAHCVDGVLSLLYEVVSGSADLLGNPTRSTIKDTIVHEGYDGLSNDSALIILNEPLTFSDTTQAVPLTDEDPVAGDTVKVTGWGILSEDDGTAPTDLYGVEVTVVDRDECAADYADVEDATIDATMVCAGVPEGGKDSCSGDSGGPLTKDGVLVGIVSWGEGCAEVGYPGVYTSVASVRQWIKDNSGI
ncbi:transmembrane protease serine 3-like [Zophobas morio]|uniref:transmembrane protease serine 3-like n=1 Tax=Zophobas morio TaxID=2755281 RepID=UPI003083BCF1